MKTKLMSFLQEPPRVAIVGAGIAGAACAAGLLRAGFDVTVFDKSRAVGGRMATRRVRWIDGEGQERSVQLDHGTPHFAASRPRFRAVLRRAQALGLAMPWRVRVHATFPQAPLRDRWVSAPDMRALCGHLLSDVPIRLESSVTRLHRIGGRWELVLADGCTTGLFDQVIVATPAAQAALLLAGHEDAWATALADVPMAPCWTLMAVTDDVDWPWDAAELQRGPLATIVRNDRKAGRHTTNGLAHWVVHATPEWSAARLEDDPSDVCDALRTELAKLLPLGPQSTWHHQSVHRWRYAMPQLPVQGHGDCAWDAGIGLGVCGDAFGDGTVQAAWCSGDELADTIAADLDRERPATADEPLPQAVH